MMEQDVGGFSLGSVVSCCFFKRFPLKLEGAVYKSYVRQLILYESEVWFLEESEMGIL